MGQKNKKIIKKKPNIRSRDKKTRFYIDNELLADYAQILKPHGIALYNVLAKHANSDDQDCFPSYETIMEQSGIGKRNTISKYLDILEDLNIITIGERGRSNYYTLLAQEEWRKLEAHSRKDRRIESDTGAQNASGDRKLVSDSHNEAYRNSNGDSIDNEPKSTKKDTLNHTNKSNKYNSNKRNNKQDSVDETNKGWFQEVREEFEEKGVFSSKSESYNEDK
jgi:hypothetical protein